MTLTIGVDVGGTKIAGGLVDENGRILQEARADSPATDAAAIVASITSMVTDLRGDHEVASIGVSAAGFIDAGRSTVLFAITGEYSVA